MHIGFQRSGGRGEYEVVGSHTGYTALSLEGWSFQLAWPDGIVRDTGLVLEPAESGKPRLRSERTERLQIGRQIAALLMLPDPRRAYAGTETGPPVARHKGYVLSRVGFGPQTEFDGITDTVTIDPTFVDLDNLTDKETVGVGRRWLRIQRIYASVDELPENLSTFVLQHRDFLSTGRAVTKDLCTIVRNLATGLVGSSTYWNTESDPLPVLEALLGFDSLPGPSLPPPSEIGEEEPVVSARSAHEYRLQKIRQAGAQAFRSAVGAAYNHRCAFCGGMFGGVRSVISGVDAAHILAWSKYDLDVVANGISLCKQHHWAFDSALLLPVYQNGNLTLKFTELATQGFPKDTLDRLAQDGFVIPSEWLPASTSEWPSKAYLEQLYADLAVSFAS